MWLFCRFKHLSAQHSPATGSALHLFKRRSSAFVSAARIKGGGESLLLFSKAEKCDHNAKHVGFIVDIWDVTSILCPVVQ